MLTLFEILKQRRKHPRFVCFLSPDLYLLFTFPKISNNCFIQRCNSSVCLTHFTGYSSSLSTPSSSSSPRLHTCQSNSHHSDLRAETFKSGSSSGSVTERERERDSVTIVCLCWWRGLSVMLGHFLRYKGAYIWSVTCLLHLSRLDTFYLWKEFQFIKNKFYPNILVDSQYLDRGIIARRHTVRYKHTRYKISRSEV